MSHAKFNRNELIRHLLGKERVIICPYGESDDPLSGPPARIQFYVGAFCFVEIDFANVSGLPELAHASVGPRGFEYIAGEDSEQDMADEIYLNARQMLWFHAKTDGTTTITRDQRRRGSAVPSSKDMVAGNSEEFICPAEGEDVTEASKMFFAKVEYLGSIARHWRNRRQTTSWYKDISWEEPEDDESRLIRKGYVSFLESFEEQLPEACVTGCREDELTFEYKGLSGCFGLEYNDSKQGFEAWLSAEPFSSSWYGRVEANLKAVYGIDDFPSNMVEDISANISAFEESVSSFEEYPIVMLRRSVKSNYRDYSIPFSGRCLYPASTAEEVRTAIGTRKPVELARTILEGKLGGYVQIDYDAQHDITRKAYGFTYDEEKAELRFSFDIDECVNVERLRSYCESEEYVYSNVSRERLKMLAELEEIEDKVDPDFIEWTLKRIDNEDGTFTYEVGEFPGISFTGDSAEESYNGIHDLLNAEIERREDSGEAIPGPFTWQQAEKYLGHE